MPDALNPLDNTRIVFDDTGLADASTVVLVHGSALSKAIWRGFGYTAALRDTYRVIAIDMRGHGRSDKPHDPASYDMPLVVADILAVLDAAEVTQVHYVGYSFGARVGFTLAHEHADRLLSFTSAGGTFKAPGSSVGELFFADYDRALETGGMQGFLDGWGAAAGAPIDPATSAAFLANDPAALRAYFAALEREPGLSAETLPSLATPTLLLAGSADTARRDDSALAATLMPNAVFAELAGRNHGTTLRPAAEVLSLVLPFLAQNSQ